MVQTVFILGAGASQEVNLPIGEGLTKSIAQLCDIRLERGMRVRGDQELFDALCTSQGGLNNLRIQAARKIHDGMPLAASIDNFLDAHRTDEHIRFIGKLAIVRSILDAERESRLFRDPREARPLDMAQIGTNWFVWFWRLLCDGCTPEEISKRGTSVSFVVFNYDRCIEQFLLFAARAYYGLTDAEGAQTVKGIRIFHPYGSLGPLPWQSNRPVEYGAGEIGPHQLVEVSKGLKTFTESTEPGAEIDELRAVVNAADRLVFLGFAYHRQNMRLLWPESSTPRRRSRKRQVYGTAKGFSESDVKLITEVIAQGAGIDRLQITLRDLTCKDLFHEYSGSLSLA